MKRTTRSRSLPVYLLDLIRAKGVLGAIAYMRQLLEDMIEAGRVLAEYIARQDLRLLEQVAPLRDRVIL